MTVELALSLSLPAWLADAAARYRPAAAAEERMRFVIGLSRHNVEARTGGPFAAAVFRMDSGEMIAAGVNCVESLNCSAAHAEVMALSFAQQRAGTYDLSAFGRFELVSSSQPCAMCFGAVLWSGVKRLVFAAGRRDVERIVGFDEGLLPGRWKWEMERRGIEVQSGLLREEAVAVLKLYKDLGLTVYAPDMSH